MPPPARPPTTLATLVRQKPAQEIGPSPPGDPAFVHRLSPVERVAASQDASDRPQHVSRPHLLSIGDGFTIPAHVPDEKDGSWSFAVNAGEVSGRAVRHRAANWRLPFEPARTTRKMRAIWPDPQPTLTACQRDCVLWPHAARPTSKYRPGDGCTRKDIFSPGRNNCMPDTV